VTVAGVRIAALGLAVAPPSGWEATIFQRSADHGERTYPVLHAATIPLPTVRADYGGGVVELLGPDDVFVSLLEFGAAAAGSALFAGTGIPGVTPDAYRPKQLQRVLRGQAGVQRFFNLGGRAFCLYSVIGSYARRGPLSYRANQLIGAMEIGAMP
jgi:hypothetical protein